MTRNKHITRKHNANKVRTIRYDKDDFLLEIFKFDKRWETIYTYAIGKYDKSSNAKRLWFNGISGLYAHDNKDLTLKFWYSAPKEGEWYRAELLYANTYKETLKSSRTKDSAMIKKIRVNGKDVLSNTEVLGNDITFNRHHQYLKLDKGLNFIEYTLKTNTVWFGLAIKKYDIYQAHRDARNSDKITMISNTCNLTNDLSINTMECELMYYEGLDDKLDPTDKNYNPSGLVFDYRDEINYYVRNTYGEMEQVFGGYISTIDLDDKITKIKLNCSDRLIDMDRRYCLSEISVQDKVVDEKEYKNYDYVKVYDDYTSPLRFVTKQTELPLKSNALINKPLVPKKKKMLADYGKKGYNTFVNDGINCTVHDDYIYIRNRPQDLDNAQYITIFDANGTTISLNDYPNLDIEYGMGKEVWEEKNVEKQITYSAITSSVSSKADEITKATGNDAVKPLWQWIVNNIRHNSKIPNFYQTPQKTLSTKVGNCCCKAELLLDWCNYKGVTDLKYIHVRKGDNGHVFCRINGRIVDPSTSRGWGDYYKGLGRIGSGKTTNYPTKPF